MRCFIGLDLSPKTKLSLQHWRQQALPGFPQHPAPSRKLNHSGQAFPQAVPAANFHITLSFLGNVTPRQHEDMIKALDEVNAEPLTLRLSDTELWTKPKAFVCLPAQQPEPLGQLVSQVRNCAYNAAIQIDKQDYRPHVTLFRKAKEPFPAPLYAPNIECEFTQFHLFESVSTPSGVHYPIRQSWPLRSALSTREKLRLGLV